MATREGRVVRDWTAERLTSGKAWEMAGMAGERATMEVRAKEGERTVIPFFSFTGKDSFLIRAGHKRGGYCMTILLYHHTI